MKPSKGRKQQNDAISEGLPVMLVPAEQELTTVEAANFLNVSRPFVIKEIESGRLPHRKVGSHCVFRPIVTDHFGIVTADFGIVTGHFGIVTEAVQ